MKKIGHYLSFFIFAFPLVNPVTALNFQVEIITNLNNPKQIIIQNDTLFSATDGGLLVYDLKSREYKAWTVGDGFFSQQFTTLTRTPDNLLILGSINGILAFLDLRRQFIWNDQSLKGHTIVDLFSVRDTLWVLAKDLVAVFLRQSGSGKYQFLDFYSNFGIPITNMHALQYARKRIWIGSESGLLSAPSDFRKFNLKSASAWSLLTTSDGLPGNEVLDIIEASNLLYLATDGGVAQFDFQQFTVFIDGLATNRVNFVKEWNGEIYAGDAHHVYRLTNPVFNTVFSSPVLEINHITFDEQGNIWAAVVDRGVHNLTIGEQIWIDGPLDNYIGKIYIDGSGRLWCTSGLVKDERKRGIFVKTEQGWKNYRFFGSGRWPSLSSSLGIMEDAAGNVWVSSWGGGVVVFDPELNFQVIARHTEAGKVWLSSLQQDDTLQVQVDPQMLDKLAGVIADDQFVVVTDMMLDPSRQLIWLLNLESRNNKPIVWIEATEFSDQIKQSSAWHYMNVPVGRFFSGSLFALTQDIFGNLWFASQRSGAFIMQIQESGQIAWGVITEDDNLKSNWCRSIAADPDGYVWIGTRSGLSVYLNGNVFDLREDYQPIGLQINHIFVDSRNNKWFATDMGLSILKGTGSPFDKSSWIHIVPQNSELFGDNIFHTNLPSGEIHSVFLDETNGDIYISSNAGLAIIHDNPFVSTVTEFNRLKVGPNPLILDGDPDTYVFFYNLVAGTEVKILTPGGQLVRRLDPANFSENKGAQAQWDGRNMEGQFVSTGVYLYLLTTEDGKNAVGKILVVRKVQP